MDHDRVTRQAYVELRPLPAWKTEILRPIAVVKTLRDLDPDIGALVEKGGLKLDRSVLNRATRILDALAKESRRRGYAFRVTVSDRDRYANSGHRKDVDDLKITIAPDTFGIVIRQEIERTPHVLTKDEERRQARGLPVYARSVDMVRASILRLEILGGGSVFRSSVWTEKMEPPLEGCLAEILRELELRHGAQGERRIEEERQRLRRVEQWQQIHALAKQAFEQDQLAAALNEQMSLWRRAAEIRGFVAEMRTKQQCKQEGDVAIDSDDWLAWAETYADSIDPTLSPAVMPQVRAPSADDLKPYMRGLCP